MPILGKTKRYGEGGIKDYKACTTCEVGYPNMPKSQCPCCGITMRTKRHGKVKYKKKVGETKEET